MKKLLFGLREEVIYGFSYPIFIKKKGQEIKIGHVSVINNVPTPPDASEQALVDAKKHKIVFSMRQRYFRKLTPEMFTEIQNKIMTGDRNKSAETE